MFRGMRSIFTAALFLGVACSRQEAAPTWPDLSQLGRSCSEADACPQGLECMVGSNFAHTKTASTCELACDASRNASTSKGCPQGYECAITIDGPAHGRQRCTPEESLKSR
jgi:hypothetical protein